MKIYLTLLLITLVILGCRKLVQIPAPQNQLTTDKVFSDTSSAVAALGNIYAEMDRTVEVNYSKYLDMYTDNLDYTGSTTQETEFYRSTVSVTNPLDLTIWQNLYHVIYACNDLIAQLPASGKIPVSNVNQLTNEAKFLRAYAYFYLVNLYGRVPLLLTTNVNENAKAFQVDTSSVYVQIIRDLSDAKAGLPADYQGAGKVRANKWAASALLARVYLFQQNWAAAETEATGIISSGLYTPLDSLSNVFLADSKEAILQIWTPNGYVTSATTLIPETNSTLPIYPVSASLISSFEPGDLRKSNWIGSSIVSAGDATSTYYYLNKYRNRIVNTTRPEYLMMLRTGEQFLIRAEARAQQGKMIGPGGAVEDINVIRNRAGLKNTTAATRADILAAIAQERRVELFGEWGERFLDLKRAGRLNAVIGAYKTTWLPAAVLLPLPQNDLTYDHNLVQNAGY